MRMLSLYNKNLRNLASWASSSSSSSSISIRGTNIQRGFSSRREPRLEDVSVIGVLVGAAAATTAVGAFLSSSDNVQPNNADYHHHLHSHPKKTAKTTTDNSMKAAMFDFSGLGKELSSSLFNFQPPSTVVQCSAASSYETPQQEEVKHDNNNNDNNNKEAMSNSFLASDQDDDDTADADPSSTCCKYVKFDHPPDSFTESHAILGSLFGTGFIERYDVYRRVELINNESPTSHNSNSHNNSNNNKSSPELGVLLDNGKKEIVIADIQIGNRLNGHKGIVHGGIITLLFDDIMGWGYIALATSLSEELRKEDLDMSKMVPVVTANLNIDFRHPLREGSSVILRVYHEKTDNRKIYFTARMESPDGKILYSEGKSLFILLRQKITKS